MAFFNPHKVDFNYDTRMIDAVGAVGRSLYEIYKDNVAKNQNQAQLDETNRANLMKEYLYGQKNQETARHNQTIEAETARKNAFDQDLGLKNFYSTDSLRRAQINNLYADNARQNTQLQWNISQARDKAQAEQEKQASIDMAWYNAGQQGGQFGELPQGLSDADKRNLGRQYRLQTEAQGGINKAQEPILKQQEAQRKQKQIDAEADIIFSQLGGQFPQGMTDPQAQREYINAYAAAKTNPQLVKQTEASAGQKNAIALNQKKFLEGMSALNAGENFINTTSNLSSLTGKGIETQSGVFDRAVNALGANISTDAAAFNASADRWARARQNLQKGNGNFNYTTFRDNLDPGLTGSKTAQETAINSYIQDLMEVQNVIDNLRAQGYAGADDYQRQLDAKMKSIEDIRELLAGKKRGAKASSGEATQLFMQKMGMPVSVAPTNSALQPPRGYPGDDLRQRLDEIGIFNEEF